MKKSALKHRSPLASVGIAILFLLIILIFCYPLFWVIMSSFKTNAEILGSPLSLPSSLSFEVYAYLFNRYDFIGYAKNSLIVSVAATALSLLFDSMGSYVLTKFNFPGKNLFFLLFTMTMLVPGHARTQPIFSLITKLNLFDTLSGLILVQLSGGLATSMFVLRSTFMSIPKELNECATIEGAGFWKTFIHVVLPNAVGGLVAAGILMFLSIWNEYYYSSLLTISDSKRTLPVALQLFTEGLSYDYTKLFGALTLVILPGILLYIIAQQKIQESFAFSGVKG